MAELLLYVAIFTFGMTAGAALMRVLFGPDIDLQGPWDPRA